MTDDDYYTIRTGGETGGERGATSRPNPLRVAVIFAAGAMAITLVAVPLMRDQMETARLGARPPDLDTRAVGSIGNTPRALPRRQAENARRYVVRRSVLSEDGVCVIRGNGGRSGNC